MRTSSPAAFGKGRRSRSCSAKASSRSTRRRFFETHRIPMPRCCLPGGRRAPKVRKRTRKAAEPRRIRSCSPSIPSNRRSSIRSASTRSRNIRSTKRSGKTFSGFAEIRNRIEMDAIEERLVSFAQSVEFGNLDRAVLDAIKQRFIDAIGCALGALNAEPVLIARKMAARLQAAGSAGVIGTRDKSSPELAAFANTAMIRFLDFNDDYFGKDGPHPSDTIGGLLAVADAVHATGREFIAAVVVAYETLCGLADAVGLRDLGWDYVTFTAAAAALGAGKLLGLD